MRATRSLVGAAAALAFILVSGAASAQPRGPQRGMRMPGPRYDKATELTLHGVVQKVEEVDQKDCPQCQGGIHLWLGSEGASYEVLLGPSWFLKEKNWSFEQGDSLEVTGSKITLDDQSSILAREVKRDGQTLMLRDTNGIPAWSRRPTS